MLARIAVTLLLLLFTAQAEACPLLFEGVKADKAHADCCPQCPKPEKVQSCFNCVAEPQAAKVIAPDAGCAVAIHSGLRPAACFADVSGILRRDLYSDGRGTYLRIGVLRI